MNTIYLRFIIYKCFTDVLLLFPVLSSQSESDLNNGLYLVIGIVMSAIICLSSNILLILIIFIVCVKNYKKNKLNDDLRSQ